MGKKTRRPRTWLPLYKSIAALGWYRELTLDKVPRMPSRIVYEPSEPRLVQFDVCLGSRRDKCTVESKPDSHIRLPVLEYVLST